MLLKALSVSFVVVLLSSGWGIGQEQEEAPGTALYRRECASCHQLSGAPVETIERMMRVTMRHLASPEVRAKTDEELSRDIADGFGKMRAFPNLSEREVVELIAYMRGLTEK